MSTPTPPTILPAPATERNSPAGSRRRWSRLERGTPAFARLLGARVRARSVSAPVATAPARPGRSLAAGPAASGESAYASIIGEAAREHALDPHLLTEVIRAESGFNPRAVSPAGAKGLMQLMDATARSLGVQDPFDPVQNVRAGARYLAKLLERYGGDVRRALAAYNAGPGAVDRYNGVPPYRETQQYVEKILARLDSSPAASRSGPVHIFGEERLNPWGPGWSPFVPGQDLAKLDPWRPGWRPELPGLVRQQDRS